MPRKKKTVVTPNAPSVEPSVIIASSPPSVPPAPPNAKLAYDRVLGEIDAVKDDELIPINLDVSLAALLVVGALPGIRKYRRDLAELPRFDMRNLTHLEDYALAARYAHVQAIPSGATQAQIRSMTEEGTALRTVLLNNADLLVSYQVFRAEEVAAVRAGQGHVDLADDLIVFGAMYEAAWKTIAGRTFVTEAQVARATTLGSELFSALGVRNWGPAEQEKTVGANRGRAYTLFVKAYDEVRRGLSYLRWHEGDVDQIAPSIYRSRAPRSASDKGAENGNGQAVEPADHGSNGAGASPEAKPPAVEAGLPS